MPRPTPDAQKTLLDEIREETSKVDEESVEEFDLT